MNAQTNNEKECILCVRRKTNPKASAQEFLQNIDPKKRLPLCDSCIQREKYTIYCVTCNKRMDIVTNNLDLYLNYIKEQYPEYADLDLDDMPRLFTLSTLCLDCANVAGQHLTLSGMKRLNT